MHSKSPPRKWRRIAMSTNGEVMTVRYSDMAAIDMVNLFYGCLQQIPHASTAMELALKKYHETKKQHGL
jgi:hypothetical protein